MQNEPMAIRIDTARQYVRIGELSISGQPKTCVQQAHFSPVHLHHTTVNRFGPPAHVRFICPPGNVCCVSIYRKICICPCSRDACRICALPSRGCLCSCCHSRNILCNMLRGLPRGVRFSRICQFDGRMDVRQVDNQMDVPTTPIEVRRLWFRLLLSAPDHSLIRVKQNHLEMHRTRVLRHPPEHN